MKRNKNTPYIYSEGNFIGASTVKFLLLRQLNIKTTHY